MPKKKEKNQLKYILVFIRMDRQIPTEFWPLHNGIFAKGRRDGSISSSVPPSERPKVSKKKITQKLPNA